MVVGRDEVLRKAERDVGEREKGKNGFLEV